MPKVVHLEVERAKAEEPHVRVVVEAWHLGDGRWWMEPSTTSRMGELRPAGWMVLADELEHYAGSLRRHAGKPVLAPVRRRRHRVRRKP
jgi:hypothetical protein